MAGDPPAGRRRRGRSLRVRTTAAAAVVVGAALAAGSLGLVTANRQTLTADVERSVRFHAEQLAEQLNAGADPASLAVGEGEDLFVQILDREGRVERASADLRGRPPLADVSPGESRAVAIPDEEEPFLVAAEDTDDGGHVVLVARSTEHVEESTEVVVTLLSVGVPVLVLLVGLTTWLVVGRTLRPVDAITREVREVTVNQLYRRVPVPGGGDEIARLAATMNGMLDRLEDGQARLRRFVADASHELRSPIAAIRQHAEVAVVHPAHTSVPDLAGAVLAESLRLQQLVDDLLLLARLDARPAANRRPVDLDDLVFAEAARLRATTSVRVDVSGVSAGRVDGDEPALLRMVANLASNAARHATAAVTFSLAARDGLVELTVDDDGPGVPEADRERIFDRFVRLDAARARDDGGAGLGLSIVAGVVAAHGGKVGVASAPAGGARFAVTLPAPPG